jgi:ABC-type multidrug transport system fused ATPase/permease subunit
LRIKAGFKVGVVGRTGAGKSTFFQSILGNLKLNRGQILIDGKNIHEVNLTDLRKQISVIPQSPMILRGSIKYNLDPLETYPITDLVRVL